MTLSPSQRLDLVDAHSLIFQVFHAIDAMTSPAGLPVNAVFGFARDILYLRSRQPDYLVCAFDRAEPTFRSEIYPEYKANRGPMADELRVQIPLIHTLLEALAVPVVSVAGYEADDVLATLARAGEARGLDVLLCTSDKDCRQLLSDRVRLYNLRKRKEFNRDDLLKEWGVTPEQVVDFQALVGDSVDNVPGVPGIGPKTAAALLQQFGSLDALLSRLNEVAGAKRQENLQAWAPQAPTSRKLVRLEDQVPIALDWEAWKLKPIDEDRVAALFREWGFRRLLPQVHETAVAVPVPAGPAGSVQRPPVQGELFPFGANTPAEPSVPSVPGVSAARSGDGAAGGPQRAPWQATYHLVATPRDFQMFLKELRRQKRFAFDVETTSLNPLEAELVGLAFCWQEGEAHYLAVRAPAGEDHLDVQATLDALRPVFEEPSVAKVNQNIKYDLLVLRQHGVRVCGVAGDPMVAHYLLHAGQRSHNLEYLAQEYLGHQVIPITDLIGKKPRATDKAARQLRMDEVPARRVAEYSGEDADVAWRLAARLEADLDREGLRKLYDDVEVPLIEVLAELEFHGIRLDQAKLRRVGEDMAVQLAAIEADIHRLAGRTFNIASPAQLRQVLFTELKLPSQRKTGVTGEASTDQETLERLAALGHELPRKILEHRQIAKLKGTYVDALPALVNPRTGRVHASFNQTVTATGRLSSSDPNLQNIPVRREQGRQVRQAFLPEPGWVLLTADYSQIELRLLAHFTEDEALGRAFAEDRDVHALVAAQIFGVDERDVSAEMRRMAKTVNFGVIYGMSAHGLSQRLQIKRDEAAKFIDAYFARYPRVQEYQARLLHECRARGYVSTLLGRRRAFDPVAIRPDSTYQQRTQTEREAINMEIQGSAADLIKLAMLRVLRRLRAEGRQARLLLQIHDELVLEAPPDELPAVATLVHEEMTAPLERELRLKVPLKVDLAAGPNWLDVDDLDPHHVSASSPSRT